MKSPTKHLILAAGGLATLAVVGAARAQSADALIDKLVQKGILTAQEASELRDETDKDFTRAHAAKTGMNEWVHSVKINGDFRPRFDGIFRDDSMPDRNRFRYRLRLGITAALTDNLDFGLRLGSGEVNGDPISLNQSMQDNGSRKPIGLDLAYLRWSPINRGDLSVSLSGGKIENPFVLSELVFDPDYTPEGAAQQFVYNLNGNHALKLNVGEFVLDELSASSLDPYLLGVQLRWEGVLSKRIGATLGLTGLGILGRQGLKTGNVPDVSQGNTRLADGNLVYNYTPVVGDAALTYTFESFPMYAGPFPVRVGAEFAHNPGAPSQNRGWDAMLAFGKAGKRRTWELAYKYKVLEGDFWFEELVDSDFGAYYKSTPVGGRGSGYQAGTNTRGHVMKASYSPYDALTLSATYYLAEAVKPFPAHSGSTIGRLQVDAVLKF